jgi:hypothetical protein
MAGKQSLIGSKAGATAKAAATAPAAKTETRWYRVLEDKQVPRTGGHDLLRAGKEVSSASRDVELLKKQGVKLEEIEPPSWYVDQQAQSPLRHAELVEAGADLGEHPEYKPAALASAAKSPPAAS